MAVSVNGSVPTSVNLNYSVRAELANDIGPGSVRDVEGQRVSYDFGRTVLGMVDTFQMNVVARCEGNSLFRLEKGADSYVLETFNFAKVISTRSGTLIHDKKRVGKEIALNHPNLGKKVLLIAVEAGPEVEEGLRVRCIAANDELKGRAVILASASKLSSTGKSISSILSSGERFDLEKVKDVAMQLLIALDFVHRMGFEHGRVNLENVVLEQDGTVRLYDWGTPCFSQGSKEGKKRDLFALGALLARVGNESRLDVNNSFGKVVEKLIEGTPNALYAIDQLMIYDEEVNELEQVD